MEIEHNETVKTELTGSFPRNWQAEEIESFIDQKDDGCRLYKVKYVTYIWQPESSLVNLQIFQDFWQQRSSKDGNNVIGNTDDHVDDDDSSLDDQNESVDIENNKEGTDPSYSHSSSNEVVYSNILGTIGNFSHAINSIQQQLVNVCTETQTNGVELQLYSTNQECTSVETLDVPSSESNFIQIESHSNDDVCKNDDILTYKSPSDDHENVLLERHKIVDNNSPSGQSEEDIQNEMNSEIMKGNKTLTEFVHDIEFQTPQKSTEISTVSLNNAVNQSPSKSFVCNVCSKNFNRATTLRRHMIIHSGEKPYQCENCGKSFNQKSVLQRHLLIHTNQKKFSCDICGMRFFEKCSMQRHKSTHDKTQKKWVCEICQKSFILKEYLAKHKILHSDKKPYKCSICSKCFADSSARRRHEKTHEESQPFSCYICKTNFKNPVSFKRHLLSCERKVAKCYICNFSFDDKSKFDAHIRFHGDKRYSCQMCNLFYDSYLHYNNHLLLHKIKRNMTQEKDSKNQHRSGDSFLTLNTVFNGTGKAPRSFDELFKTALSSNY